MPSEIMQQQGLFPSSFFSEDIYFANEVGFRMSEAILDRHACKKSIAPYPLEKTIQREPQNMSLHHLESFATQDDKRNLSLVVRAVGAERKTKQSFPLAQHENSLFGSSLSDLLSREMILSPNSVQYGHSVETTFSSSEGEPLGSLEEIEAQTIGNLLPDDDDLFSGMNNGFVHSLHPKNTEDAEETDFFSSVGGIELGDDVFSNIRGSEQQRDFANADGQRVNSAIQYPLRDRMFNHTISSSVSSPTTANMNAEMFQSSRFCMPNQNGQAFHLSEGGFASASNGNHLHPGFSDTWSNTYSSTISPVMWPNPPSVRNGNPISHCKTQLHGLPRAPSAPTLSNPLWERRRSYTAPSLESLSFNPGSIGNLGVPCRSHYMDFSSCNIFRHGCGNCMEPTNALRLSPQTSSTMCSGRGLQSPQISPPIYNARGGLPSPQASATMYNGRGLQSPQTSPPMYNGRGQSQNSADSTNERSRSRRNEGSVSQADKKQFELDVDRIASGEDKRTTLMIKNIPNKYTSKMLLAAIDEHHKGTYDFIYLPIDFKNKCNVGYAFINMTNPSHIIPIYETFKGKKWEKFNSEKVASIAYGRIQGKAALIAHFQNSSLMNEDKRCRPILFNTDGPNAGDQVPFPMGINVWSRQGRTVKNDS